MKKILKNYKQTIILLLSLIVGVVVGLIFKEDAKVLSPFGDIFMNLLFVVIVPLIFLTITSSIAKMKSGKRLGKVLTSILIVFIITSIIAVIIGFLTTFKMNLVNVGDTTKINEVFDQSLEVDNNYSILERTAKLLTTNDFVNLFSKDNLIALLVISLLVGFAIRMSKEKGEKFREFIDSANEVLMNLIKLIMYYAPIGLGCYIASLVGTFGGEIATGFLKVFVIYTIVAVLYYFIIYSLYAFIGGGKKGLKAYWKNILPATITAIATCSSAASIPVNRECTKKMGVSDDIADTIIPLGTSFHKDGSIIGSVFKIMFLVCLFGMGINTFGDVAKIFGVALLANLLISAVPIGGGSISEMLIITLMGFAPAALPVLTIIATVIDPPATMLNVVGDSASSMLVSRMVDGKKWNMKD